jgi:hypothetical protein
MDSKDYRIHSNDRGMRTMRTKEDMQCKKERLTSIFGEGARVLPPSMKGTPIDAAKTRRSPGRGATGTKKKRDNLDIDDGIGKKKSKSDDEESWEGVANLEKMADTLLKPKGLKPKSRKGSTKKDKTTKNPRLREEKGDICRDCGKRGGKRKRD